MLGTQLDNMLDAVSMGRLSKQHGELGHNSKLTNAQALEIREKYSSYFPIRNNGEKRRLGPPTYESIGKEYGVSRTVIFEIIRGRTFKN